MDSPETVDTHPVQVPRNYHEGARCNTAVTMAAYEVYCHVYCPQPAMVKGDCRGGFGAGELIAFLYARAFPKNEWRDRVDEALKGMRQL
jgi:hypothetical protein